MYYELRWYTEKQRNTHLFNQQAYPEYLLHVRHYAIYQKVYKCHYNADTVLK